MTSLADHACRIAEELGRPVFPVRVEPDREHPGKTIKRPLVKGWQNGGSGTHPEFIEASFARAEGATHVGIVTGGGLLVIDLDGEPGQQWWRDHQHLMPMTRTQRTQRTGGLHLFYRVPSDCGLRNSASKIAPGVDIRCDGGFVVDWSMTFPPEVEDVADAPAELIELLRRRAEKSVQPAPKSNGAGAVPPGGRNSYLSGKAYALRRDGATPEQIMPVLRAMNEAICNPPLSDDEVKRIAWGKAQVQPEPKKEGDISATDFYAYLPAHQYLFVPTRELWPATSVNAKLPKVEAISATEWLDQNRAVAQMTWAPGHPMLIEGKLIDGGGWIERPGVATFNLYRPPVVRDGDPSKAGPWLEHIERVYPNDADHIVCWLAHRVQRPGEKINHALVLGGAMGIGKDTILEPLKQAVGPWNFQEVSPPQLLGRFNGFLKSVVLRVSEARDLGDVDRYGFYDHMKAYTAAPPDVLRCDEKYLREHSVLNVCGVIITTNHKDGIYLPADDRRHYVAWSELTREQFTEDYWTAIYGWYAAGGIGHVTAYLRELDLTGWNPKAPPRKTPAFWEVVDANRAPEDGEMADTLDKLGNPDALTLADIRTYASDSFREFLEDRRNRRQIPHRLDTAGYVPVRNEGAKDGLWKVGGIRQAIYAKAALSPRDRIAAAAARAAQ